MTRGLTLIELTVVLAILATLMSIGIVNLLKTQQVARVRSSTTQIVADIKAAQIQSMAGDTQGTGSIAPHGIYFEPDKYTLFRGSVYSPSDPSNFTILLEPNLVFSTSFPSSTLVFEPVSGEISGFTPGNSTVTLTDATSTEAVNFQFNSYGVITSVY